VNYNKYKPYLLILPEDQAVLNIVNGALEALEVKEAANVTTEELLAGWREVKSRMPEYHKLLTQNQLGYLLIIIDFDKRPNRYEEVEQWIPKDIKKRCFILSCSGQPEELKREVGLPYDEIGQALVKDCPEAPAKIWKTPQLVHNLGDSGELHRFLICCRDILFE